MPRRDGKGPMKMGRMMGKGASCRAGFMTAGYANPAGYARGHGCGFGRGNSSREMFNETGLPRWMHHGYPVCVGMNAGATNEKDFLNNQADFLEKQLQRVKKRLSLLEEDEK